MAEVVLFIFIVLYSLVVVKVEQWYTISALGFRSETPEMFLRRPWRYSIVRLVLFLVTVGISLFTTFVPWYICIVILVALWFVNVMIGRIKAFNNYRQVLHEMMEYAESSERRAELEADSKKTNRELMDAVLKYRAMLKYMPDRWI